MTFHTTHGDMPAFFLGGHGGKRGSSSYVGTDYRTRPYYGITVCDTVCICTIWLTQRMHLQDCAERRADLRYRLVAELLVYHTCKRFRAQILSLGAATGGLAGVFEAAGGAAQEQAGRPGPWLWQEWPWGAAASEGGRRVNRLEDTHCMRLDGELRGSTTRWAVRGLCRGSEA